MRIGFSTTVESWRADTTTLQCEYRLRLSTLSRARLLRSQEHLYIHNNGRSSTISATGLISDGHCGSRAQDAQNNTDGECFSSVLCFQHGSERNDSNSDRKG